MNTPPILTTPTVLPLSSRQPSARTIRALGWFLLLIGPGLSVAMLVVAGSLFDTIYYSGQHTSRSHWHGGPAFTRMAFELFGAVFLLGIAIFAGGVYQVRTGRRHPVLVAIVLLLAAAIAFLVYGIIASPSMA